MKLEITLIGIILALAIVINLSMAADEKDDARKNTYMGVDADDKEAVSKRQKELAHEKWQELFGSDVDINHVDFSPEFGNSHFKEGVKILKDALKNLIGLFNKRPADLTTTTPAPKPDDYYGKSYW